MKIARRTFLGGLAGSLAASGTASAQDGRSGRQIERVAKPGLRLGLNAYSFNNPLQRGELNLHELIAYSAELGFEGVDATGYYFSTYPAAPPDGEVFALKRWAFVNALSVYGTGVRNDFATADEQAKERDIAMVKAWIETAQKLGAGILRVFAGTGRPEADIPEEMWGGIASALRECADYGARNGVILAVQNHNDVLKTADQTIRLLDAVDSEWCAAMLDIGSLRQGDPYREIEKLAPYAVGWQLKESVWFGEEERPVDLDRLGDIIAKVGYRGFLSIETLGEGDPRKKVEHFLSQVVEAFS